MTEKLIYFWLGISGITSRRANNLLSECTPLQLWENYQKLNKAQVGERAYDALIRFHSEEYLNDAVNKLEDMGVGFITINEYSQLLSQREVDPPVMLYYKGNINLINTDCVAMVGTRACSSYGKEAATKLSEDLCGYGVTIVSGLATGIDTYSHRAAVKCGGKTIAVLGSGVNCITPASNRGLSEEILASGGLILSEYAPRNEATYYTFPERNRIVSGLSKGVIVVEAGLKSGALITADYAAEQGRTVFAVPANITSSKSVGSNRLLYDGAVAALTAVDICETLGIDYKKAEKKSIAIQLDIFEQKIYNILRQSDENFDSLVVKAEIASPRLAAMLSAMEIKGIIKKKQSNVYGLA